MAKFNTIDDMDLDGKVVLTRVDVNVPVEDGQVTDTTRIDKIVPTVKDIQAKGGIPVRCQLAHTWSCWTFLPSSCLSCPSQSRSCGKANGQRRLLLAGSGV